MNRQVTRWPRRRTRSTKGSRGAGVEEIVPRGETIPGPQRVSNPGKKGSMVRRQELGRKFAAMKRAKRREEVTTFEDLDACLGRPIEREED
jgi:hypothetical protein